MASSYDAGEFARLRAGGFVGAARRLDDIDLPRIGAMVGVGEDEIHAIIDVESGGSGFDKLKRPKMLYEPHVFWRNATAEQRARGQSLGIAYPNWKPGSYPSDSYPRLAQALAINETAALRACSWGMTQILGENHVACGYSSPQAMVLAFCADEEEHLEATVMLLKSMGLAGKLKAHDWAGVARGWNGPGYAKNAYDDKLAARFAHWKAIPDTPWTPGQSDPAKPAPVPPVIVVPLLPPLSTGANPAAVAIDAIAPKPLPVVPSRPAPPVATGETPSSGLRATIAARLRAAFPLKKD